MVSFEESRPLIPDGADNAAVGGGASFLPGPGLPTTTHYTYAASPGASVKSTGFDLNIARLHFKPPPASAMSQDKWASFERKGAESLECSSRRTIYSGSD